MTDEQRDNLLLSIAKSLDALDTKFEEKIGNLEVKFENKFNELDAKFEEKIGNLEVKFEDKFNELDSKYAKKTESLDTKIERYHQEVMRELERQRMNMAKLENNLLDKIEALFDVREINNDKFKEHDAMIKDIDKTLDWHHRRLLRLETNS